MYLSQSESVILSETIVTNIRRLVNDKFYDIGNAEEYEIFMDDLYKIVIRHHNLQHLRQEKLQQEY
jgi:hypothetical protein